jgi:hypothetical protein
MEPAISTLASGLKFFMFQGMEIINGEIVVATLDGDLLRVGLDGTTTPWVNIINFGVPNGMIAMGDKIGVVVSAQESGHALIEVGPDGKASQRADFAGLAGEFGAPFDLTAHKGDRPYYLVTIATDVVRTGGVIARVTPAGKVSVVTQLSNTPFCIDTYQNQILLTQDNGQVMSILPCGRSQLVADFKAAGLGTPFGITHRQQEWLITTTDGWLVRLAPDGTLTPLTNITKVGLGAPTTLTWFDREACLIVATGEGNLLRIDL